MKTWFRFPCVCIALSFAAWFNLAAISSAQDKTDATEAAAEADDAADQEKAVEEEPEEKDPFALPEDADANELFQFISKLKSNMGRNRDKVLKTAKTVISATEAIRSLEGVDPEDEMKALKEELGALNFVSRSDGEYKKKLSALLEALDKDERPQFNRFAKVQAFSSELAKVRGASVEQLQATVDRYKELVGNEELDREVYMLGSSLARMISDPEQAEVAAELYEYLAERMADSSDESLSSRAVKMVGAARRVRLPGKEIEIVCPTADGEALDWESYRGKVVLVDFWASWCGPCRAEIPNMKRNLAAYGTDAFEIVGVNLDRSKSAMDKYVEENELTWTNLISDDESQMGWDNPMATYYGINAIPTAILVDQKGRVVSMRARGEELDRMLLELIGEPKNVEPEESEDGDEDGDEDAEKDEE